MVQKLLYFATLSLLLGLIINSSAVAGLIASYDFESNFKDSSGNGLHGKQNGDASIIKDADRKSQVLSLDGKGDYVNIGNDKRFNWNGAFSACFWMKVTLWQANWDTVLKKDGAWSFERHINQNALAFYHWPNFVPTVANTDDQWHHIATTYAKKEQKLYKDGELVVNKPNAGDMNENANPVIIGAANGTSRYFNGLLDDVRIYDNALSEDEVKKDMAAMERLSTNLAHKLALTWGRIKTSR